MLSDGPYALCLAQPPRGTDSVPRIRRAVAAEALS